MSLRQNLKTNSYGRNHPAIFFQTCLSRETNTIFLINIWDMRMDSKNIIKNFKQHNVPLLRGIEQGDVLCMGFFFINIESVK